MHHMKMNGHKQDIMSLMETWARDDEKLDSILESRLSHCSNFEKFTEK